MHIDTTFYEDRLKEFKRYHPYMVEHILHVRPRGEAGIRVTLKDGTQYDFGSMENGVRRVVDYTPDALNDITDERCRDSFAYRLTELMSARGFTQQSLVEYTGLSKGAINNYLNKKATPSFTAARRIAYALGCSVSELID